MRLAKSEWAGVRAGQEGFSLRELGAVLATVVMLGLIALPSLARNGEAAQGTRCLSNLRELTRAWLLYAEDNDGRFAQNLHGGEAQGGAAARDPGKAPWALGWLDWGTSTDNTNRLLVRDAKYAKLSPYLGAAGEVHRCPADRFVSRQQLAKGWAGRVRSVSMNASIGDGNAQTGPWDPIYKQARDFGSLLNPGAGETIVLMEEHPDSINDPLFFPPRFANWVDWPANYHNGAAGFSFADGHTELHAWIGATRHALVRYGNSVPFVRARDADLGWVSYRSQRAGEKHF